MNISKFNLHSWASNSQSLRDLAIHHIAAHEKEVVKVLGLCWNIKLDELSLCCKPEGTTNTLVTKQEILHYASSIFDPLGLITSVTITAKLLLQELWQDSVPWDTELNEAFQLKWASNVVDISIALQQHFLRQYIPLLLSVDPSPTFLQVLLNPAQRHMELSYTFNMVI